MLNMYEPNMNAQNDAFAAGGGGAIGSNDSSIQSEHRNIGSLGDGQGDSILGSGMGMGLQSIFQPLNDSAAISSSFGSGYSSGTAYSSSNTANDIGGWGRGSLSNSQQQQQPYPPNSGGLLMANQQSQQQGGTAVRGEYQQGRAVEGYQQGGAVGYLGNPRDGHLNFLNQTIS